MYLSSISDHMPIGRLFLRKHGFILDLSKGIGSMYVECSKVCLDILVGLSKKFNNL